MTIDEKFAELQKCASVNQLVMMAWCMDKEFRDYLRTPAGKKYQDTLKRTIQIMEEAVDDS